MRTLFWAWLMVCGLCSVAAAEDPLWAAVAAFRSGHYEEARTGFEALRDADRATDYGAYLGPTYFKLGRLEDARRALAPAFRRGDQDPVATYYLALTYYRLGFQRLARSAFEEVQRGAAGPKLTSGAQRFLAELERAQDPLGAEPVAAFATNLETIAPDVAFDYGMEALLRASTPAETQAATRVLGRLLNSTHGGARAFASRITGRSLAGAEPVRDLGMGGGNRAAPRFYLPELTDRL